MLSNSKNNKTPETFFLAGAAQQLPALLHHPLPYYMGHGPVLNHTMGGIKERRVRTQNEKWIRGSIGEAKEEKDTARENGKEKR